MNLANESEMSEILGITRQQLLDYVEANVFAPCIRAKGRGRPSKNKGAVYDVETVQKEFHAFQAGNFSPAETIGPSNSIQRNNDGSTSEDIPEKTGQVIRLPGIESRDKEIPDFDYKTEIGELKTLKQVRLKMLEIAPRPDIPDKIKRAIERMFELMSAERARRDAKKKRVPIEKHESDCQKIFDAWASAFSGKIGLDAAESIVSEMESQTGKSFRRELSSIVQIVHRGIARAAKEVIQPQVLRILEKI